LRTAEYRLNVDPPKLKPVRRVPQGAGPVPRHLSPAEIATIQERVNHDYAVLKEKAARSAAK
jgi:hypothetical protein